ncbi:hypothetical protein AAG906_027209 [Vitis piasezkii]
MVETSRDWSEKLPFALWAYRTSFRTSIGATPYSLVYGMEATTEIEMGSLRVALEHISEGEWARSRYDQLNLLDEKRLRAADHVQAYQRKMTRAFRKRVKGLINDPRGKFRPSWSGPYVIRDLTREGFTEPLNVDHQEVLSPLSSLFTSLAFPYVMMMRSSRATTQSGHILSFHLVYLPQGMLPSLHAGFGSLYMYAGIPFRLVMLWTSKFELGHNSFFSPLVTFVSLSYRGIPHSFHLCLISGFFQSFVGNPRRHILGIPFVIMVTLVMASLPHFSSVVPRHRARVRSPEFHHFLPEASPVTRPTLLQLLPGFYPFLPGPFYRHPFSDPFRYRLLPITTEFFLSLRAFFGTAPVFSVLARTLLRYLPEAFSHSGPFSKILEFYPFRLTRIPPFCITDSTCFGTCPNPSPVLAQIKSLIFPGIVIGSPFLFLRHRA